MILAGELASEDQVRRFYAEAEAAAHLDHPAIVPIYEVGEISGQHFYAMGFVEGPSLAAKVALDGPLPSREAAELIKTTAEAVAYAHAEGVIHRDLKPSNILLDAGGRPRVADFGLAKRLEADAELTSAGNVIGTPSYMPPEQAAGRTGEVGPLADVYSLGATLYALLTGRPPFRAASRAETARQVIEREPVAPRELNPAIDRDLETITLKCLSKDRARRYQSADELANDLARYLAGEPIHARPVGTIERSWRWSRRHPAAAGAVIAVLVGLVSVSALTVALAMTNTRLQASIKAETAAKNTAEKKRQEASAVLAFLQNRVLAAARPEDLDGGLGFNTTLLAAIDAAEPHIAAAFAKQPIAEAFIRNSLGNTYQYLGKSETALPQYQRARDLFVANLGPEHPHALKSIGCVALAYRHTDKLKEALPLYQQTLERMKATLGSQHPDTLRCMNNLAEAHRAAGNTDQARTLHEQTLKLKTTSLGPKHPSTLASMHNLAGVYQSAGKLDEAISLYQKTLELMRAELGPEHPTTLTSMHGLAGAYRSVGKASLAVPLLEQLLITATTKVGEEAPQTLQVMNNLAQAYRAAGKLDQAIPLHEKTLKLLQAHLGAHHAHTLGSMNNLAEAYRAEGKLNQALPLYEKTLELSIAHLGVEHAQTLTSMNNLAVAYQAAGKLDEALPLYEKTLKLLRATLGSKHVHTLASMGNLAETYLLTKQPQKALALYEECVAGKRLLAGDNPLRFANRLSYISHQLLRHQQHGAAEKYLRECLSIHERIQPDHWVLFSVKSRLGAALAAQKKFEKAEPLLLEGYQGLKQREGKIPAESKPLVAVAVEQIVDLYQAWEKPDEAAKWRKKLPKAKTPPVKQDN